MAKRKTSSLNAEQRFTRRAFLLGGTQGILGSLLLGRLFYLGGYKGSDYKALSDENRIKAQFVLPKRGLICDRQHYILADNKQIYRLMIVPEQARDVRHVLMRLGEIYPVSQETMESVLESIRYKPKFLASPVLEGISWQDVCCLSVRLRDFPGCFIEQGWARLYPYGEALAHLVGYVQTPSLEDQEENALYRLTDFRLGKAGIEKWFDTELRGQPGYRQLEVNARGKTIRELEATESTVGAPCHLSIDVHLQTYVQERLQAEKSASSVVLNIKTGEILALNSSPSFDPNLFTNGIRSSDWQALVSNPYGCLHNKTIQGMYPPGSLFKMVVALAAFDSEKVASDYTTICRGYMEVGSHRFHCWHRQGGHGTLSLVRALSESCDIYFYELAQRIGVDCISSMARRLGFGSPTGIELPHEKSGLVPTKDWKKRIRRESWRIGDTLNYGIGQGAMLATPIQLAVMMGRLLRGVSLTPTLSKKAQSGPLFDPLGFRKSDLELIKKGMDFAVNAPQGLAYRNRILIPGMEMGGKTATCQVRRITMAERKRGVLKNEQRPWDHRDHALFAGYAPIHNPQYVVTVVVEHGGSGGSVAGPIGRDILLRTQQVLQKG